MITITVRNVYLERSHVPIRLANSALKQIILMDVKYLRRAATPDDLVTGFEAEL